MMNFIIIAFMSITSRQSGGGLGAKYLPHAITWLPELFFSLGIAGAVYIVLGPIIGLFSGVWSYLWMQAATANGLHWGRGEYRPERDAAFSPVVNWISDRIGIDRSSVNYCRLYMGVKGFLIGLPLGGIPLAILWPLGYDIGARFNNHAISEMAAGAGAGISILLYLVAFL